MANKIKGITIEIGGDTTGLDKALKGVNSEIRNTQNELKEVEKSLKLDPSNIDLLEQKQRLLGEAVQATKEKLDTLKEAQAQAAEQLARGDIGQEQYDALTREVANTEAALKKATDQADKFNVAAEQMKSKLSAVSDAAGKVAEATKGISSVGAGVVAGIGTLALNSAKAADELNTLSQQSGLSTEELQKMQYASGLVDVSLEAMVGAQSKLRKSMGGSGDAFKELGIVVRASNGEMRDSNAVFYDTLQALSRVQNETKRDQLAMEIFGKSADQLAGIIDDGGAALKAYGEEAAQLGIILDQETLDSMNKVDDELEKLKAQAKGDLAKAGASALEALTPVIEDVVNVISKLLDKIGSMSSTEIEIIGTIGLVMAALSPVAGLISGVTGAVGKLLELWPAIATAFEAISAFVIANPIILIIAAVAALAVAIITHWEEIKPVLEELWAKVQELVGNLIAKIKDFFEKVRTTLQNIVTVVKTTFETVRSEIVSKFEALKEKITSIWTAVKDFFTETFTTIADTVKTYINVVIGWVNKGIDSINGLIEKINNSGIAQTLGINIGTIGNIPELATSDQGNAMLSQNGRASGGATTNNYNTSNVYNQTSQQPVQVNLKLDSKTVATQLVTPMRTANAAAGGSNIR